ncbi:histidine triad nucleotide-binding protein 3-like [Ctenocephalides felis]|uniref:histidine triad nucleotide-binding protein 3-like n=1 Tax=Ctenocephalides felis TaxID=7515 RepID=UPI000E6E1461|nr:histidine triad nucleotide-binding protein 3-like [Ctenocephalides felis]XP_026477540.1 histidine triad nucleotide-binding protein 3-like [Ctenocephalides felis]
MNRIANCVFCQICEGTAPSNTIFKNENFIVFACRTQATKHHYLVCPIQHINDAKSLVPGQETLVEEMYKIAKQIVIDKGENLNEARFGFHWPPFHSISHLHLHILAPVDGLRFFHRLIYKPNSMWFVSPEYVITWLKTHRAIGNEETSSN